MQSLITGDVRPQSGDLVLARIEELGKQSRLELTTGRRAYLFPGDEIVVAYGNRYAPDQYEAIIGIDLSPCDLVAAGGLASTELSRHLKILPPTRIAPVGLLGDATGERLNLSRFGVTAPDTLPPIPGVLSLGTSMNAGKTLAAASMVKGFKRLGLKVAALKITGTGSGGDMWIVQDAGADYIADFTDAGYPSTYLTPIAEIEALTYRLTNQAAAEGCDLAVIEIADGLQQRETAQLVRSPAIQAMTLATVFSAYDSMGALSGIGTLRAAGHPLVGLSGRIGLSPLGVREAEDATGQRYFSPFDLQAGALMPALRQEAARAVARLDRRLHPALAALAGDLGAAGPIQTEAAPMTDQARTTARKALGLIADFIIDRKLRRLNGAARGRTFAHRIWSTPFGLVHVKAPKIGPDKLRLDFLDMPVDQLSVRTLVETLGAPQSSSALQHLVRTMGGRDFDSADLSDLLRRVVEAGRDAGLAIAGTPVEQPLMIDAYPLPQFYESAPESGGNSPFAEDVMTTPNPSGAGLFSDDEPVWPVAAPVQDS